MNTGLRWAVGPRELCHTPSLCGRLQRRCQSKVSLREGKAHSVLRPPWNPHCVGQRLCAVCRQLCSEADSQNFRSKASKLDSFVIGSNKKELSSARCSPKSHSKKSSVSPTLFSFLQLQGLLRKTQLRLKPEMIEKCQKWKVSSQ